MAGIAETLIRETNRRGIVMFVNTNGRVAYFPKRLMSSRFLRLLESQSSRIKAWLIADAITAE